MKLKMSNFLVDNDAPTRSFSRFRKNDEGSIVIFSLFMFVLILWLAGMAVDFMRFETTRAKIQGTLDRATLAAADLEQTLPCRAVVEDYFEKADLIDFLGTIDCDEGLNYRVVNANAQVEMPLFFFDIPKVFSQPFSPGLTTLTVSGTSTAEERVTDVEVSLVLDVSSSMNSNNRITNLRPAAREFVTTVLANNTNAPQGLITVSMIPYSATVNTGVDIANLLDLNGNVNRTHSFSTCLLFENDDWFTTTALDLGIEYNHVGHFDPAWFGGNAEPINHPWCPAHIGTASTPDLNAIVPVSSNEAALHTAINNLDPYGNTAIDMGMKWGVGLLDPSTRNIITALAAQPTSSVDGSASGRPYDYTQEDVLKVIVLMTDGTNTTQYDLRDRFKTENSFIWFDLSDDPNRELYEVSNSDISIQYSGQLTPFNYKDDRFFWNGNGTQNPLHDFPRGYTSRSAYEQARQNHNGLGTSVGVGPTFAGDVRNASWQEIYANWEHDRIDNELTKWAYNFGALPLFGGTGILRDNNGNVLRDEFGAPIVIDNPDFNDSSNAINTNIENASGANSRLSNLCAAARAEDIVIYTVAFEAPSGGQQALLDCADVEGRYFDVDGTDITAAFSAIASEIRALKLTQ